MRRSDGAWSWISSYSPIARAGSHLRGFVDVVRARRRSGLAKMSARPKWSQRRGNRDSSVCHEHSATLGVIPTAARDARPDSPGRVCAPHATRTPRAGRRRRSRGGGTGHRPARPGQAIHGLPETDAHHLCAAQLGHLGRGGRVAARPVQRHRERQGRGRSAGLLLLGRPDHQGQGRQVPHVHEHVGGLGGLQSGLDRLRRLPCREPDQRARALQSPGLRLHQQRLAQGTQRLRGGAAGRGYAVVVSEIVPFTIYKSSSLDGPWTGCTATISTNGVNAGTDTHYDPTSAWSREKTASTRSCSATA